MSYATPAASILGATVIEKCEIERVMTDGRKVTGVQTNQGTIHCKHFVNASGMVGESIST